MNDHHETFGGKVLDVVCGMWIDPQTAPAHYTYRGRTYYFCAPGCLHLFRENPEAFLKSREKQTEGRGLEGHDPTAAREEDAHAREHAHAHGHKHRHGHRDAHGRGGHGGCGECGRHA